MNHLLFVSANLHEGADSTTPPALRHHDVERQDPSSISVAHLLMDGATVEFYTYRTGRNAGASVHDADND